VAALEADKSFDQPSMDWLTSAERAWLKGTMRTIALEEATHSALAWRTIYWICQVDSVACEETLEKVLVRSNLDKALKMRLQDRSESFDEIKKVWKTINTSLIHLLVGSVKTEQLLDSLSVATDENDEDYSLVKMVSQLIIESVASAVTEQKAVA